MQKDSKLEPLFLVSRNKNNLWQIISRLTRFIVLVLLCSIIGILNPSFFSINNLQNILRQFTPVLVLAFGQMVVIVGGGIDLSMGGVGAVAGAIMATMYDNGQSMLLSILIGIIIGALFGLINGLLVTSIGLPPFIATFGTYLVGRGVVVWILGGKIIYKFPEPFRFIGAGKVLGMPTIFLIGLIIIAFFYVLLNRTSFGSALYYTGSNQTASIISGIKVKRILNITYIISGIMSAFACILFVSRLNSMKSDIGEGFEMDGISGALVGGVSFSGGIGNVSGTVLGALIIVILRNSLNMLGVSQNWHGVTMGTMMILMILADEILRRRVGNR